MHQLQSAVHPPFGNAGRGFFWGRGVAATVSALSARHALHAAVGQLHAAGAPRWGWLWVSEMDRSNRLLVGMGMRRACPVRRCRAGPFPQKSKKLEWVFAGGALIARILGQGLADFVDADHGTRLERGGLDGDDVAELTAEGFDGLGGIGDLLLGVGALGGIDDAVDGTQGQQVLDQGAQFGDGAGGRQVVLATVIPVVADDFGALGDDVDVLEFELFGDVDEELALFGDALGQGDVRRGPHDGQDDAGDAGAGAHVDHTLGRGGPKRQVSQGVEDVFGDHLGGVFDGGQIEHLVPLAERLEVGHQGCSLGGRDGDHMPGEVGVDGVKEFNHAALR